MSELAVLGFSLIALCAISWMGTRAYNKRITTIPHTWSIQEHSTAFGIVVMLECPGEVSQQVGSPLKVHDPDFDYKIEELYAEARQRLGALQSASLTRGS